MKHRRAMQVLRRDGRRAERRPVPTRARPGEPVPTGPRRHAVRPDERIAEYFYG